MHTASYPPQAHGRVPVYDLDRVRSQGFTTLEGDRDQDDDGDNSALIAERRTARSSRWRRIAVRVVAYLAIAAMLYLFSRVMVDNPAMRRAVLDFVTFGHAEAAHTAGQWVVKHGVSIHR